MSNPSSSSSSSITPSASAPAVAVSVASVSSPSPPTARRDVLRSIEISVQKEWAEKKIWEQNAPQGDFESTITQRDPKSKFLATFPYPYMNGVLHLGHAFTLTKADFACQYQRLKGKKVLFPFAFHCTGMPIAACAEKLKREIITFGNPPKFPVDTEAIAVGGESKTSADGEGEGEGEGEGDEKDFVPHPSIPNDKKEKEKKDKKGKSSKSKVGKKASKEVYQWNIMREMGIPEPEIPLFQDAKHWLSHFPPIGQKHLKEFGLSADFRRAFITTNINPFYDAFIRWQFNTLRQKDKLSFGRRMCVFSPMEQQPCADHDRAKGEGIGLTDYTLIKLTLEKPFPKAVSEAIASASSSSPSSSPRVILPAATLRPETMYGQTNCWVLPDGDYGIFLMANGEYFICSTRSANNMSYQDFTGERGKVNEIGRVKGSELIGSAVIAPLSPYPKVFILPLTTIKMDKGTGIVTSVPSDSPDDWAALNDLKTKAPFRAKFGLFDSQVLPFEVIEIVHTPGLGNRPAESLCLSEKVNGQGDREKLELLKEKVYKEGFAKGIMLVGEFKGDKVSDAKPKIKGKLISEGHGAAYSEPEGIVISRSGVECVAALTDQWYLKYGEEKWQDAVRSHVDSTLECYNPQTKIEFQSALSWLHEWGCSRSFGMGSYLPWDQQWVIESLSDSTIYMAYYTICHLLQSDSLIGNKDGKGPGTLGIRPESLTDSVFNYIFLHRQHPLPPTDCDIPIGHLDILRREFEFWYPLDLRVSGKDLIANHLTFCLYNHAAIWENQPEMWPQSFWTNGHVLIDSQKMSKSEGRFITIEQAIQEYSADATRFALAEAGDTMDDANFEKKVANAAILKITKESTWVKEEVLPVMGQMRRGVPSFADSVFTNEISRCIQQADGAYQRMQFRDALKAAFHDLAISRDAYRLSIKSEKDAHYDAMKMYLFASIQLLSPICPHYCQHMWEVVCKSLGDDKSLPHFVCHSAWPLAPPVDFTLLRQNSYVENLSKEIRNKYFDGISKGQKGKEKDKSPQISNLKIFISLEYPRAQQEIIAVVREITNKMSSHSTSNSLSTPLIPLVPDRSKVISSLRIHPSFSEKKSFEFSTKFSSELLSEMSIRGTEALELKSPFDERALIQDQLDHQCLAKEVLSSLSSVHIVILTEEDVGKLAGAELTCGKKAMPGKPSVYFY